MYIISIRFQYAYIRKRYVGRIRYQHGDVLVVAIPPIISEIRRYSYTGIPVLYNYVLPMSYLLTSEIIGGIATTNTSPYRMLYRSIGGITCGRCSGFEP